MKDTPIDETTTYRRPNHRKILLPDIPTEKGVSLEEYTTAGKAYNKLRRKIIAIDEMLALQLYIIEMKSVSKPLTRKRINIRTALNFY